MIVDAWGGSWSTSWALSWSRDDNVPPVVGITDEDKHGIRFPLDVVRFSFLKVGIRVFK